MSWLGSGLNPCAAIEWLGIHDINVNVQRVVSPFRQMGLADAKRKFPWREGFGAPGINPADALDFYKSCCLALRFVAKKNGAPVIVPYA